MANKHANTPTKISVAEIANHRTEAMTRIQMSSGFNEPANMSKKPQSFLEAQAKKDNYFSLRSANTSA